MQLPSDDERVLAVLASPPPPLTQDLVAGELMLEGRNALLLRAVDEGVIDPASHFPGEGYSLMHQAVALDNVRLLRALVLGKGVSPNVRGADTFTPLIQAVDLRKVEAALFLINEAPGVNLNTRMAKGTTARSA